MGPICHKNYLSVSRTGHRTYEGWFYLAVVVDLFSRKVVGWSMNQRMEKHLVTQAMLSAVWRRKPQAKVIVHSDQGSQYTSDECQRFIAHHNIDPSMSRRGNCYDNAVAESFFHSLKSERIRGKIYKTREEARQDIFDYIEWFYNPQRRHSHCDNMPPNQFEEMYYLSQKSL
ncbi:MAG: IS3 family transposase [Proteobacteria bacterium]|nr:IS3 family transposase [Pseudomonadota bacterium]